MARGGACAHRRGPFVLGAARAGLGRQMTCKSTQLRFIKSVNEAFCGHLKHDHVLAARGVPRKLEGRFYRIRAAIPEEERVQLTRA